FVAGILVGVWTQHSRPLPPPPMGAMGEFGRQASFNAAAQQHAWVPGSFRNEANRPTPEELRRRMHSMIPQIKLFQAKLDAIELKFRTSFMAILNPHQQQQLSEMEERIAKLPTAMRGCAPEMGPIFISMVIYRPLYEHLAEELA